MKQHVAFGLEGQAAPAAQVLHLARRPVPAVEVLVSVDSALLWEGFPTKPRVGTASFQ